MIKIDKNFLDQDSEGFTSQRESEEDQDSSDDQFVQQKSELKNWVSLINESRAEMEATSGWDCTMDDIIDEIE